MKLRIVRRIGYILLAVAGILLGISLLMKDELWVMIFSISGLITFLGDLVFLIIFWRCPSCHKILPTQGSLNMTYCPYCGEDLDIDAIL